MSIHAAAVPLLAGVLALLSACECGQSRDRTPGETSVAGPSLSPHELIDIIARYYPRVDARDFGPDQEYDAYVRTTPEFRAWEQRIAEGFGKRDQWLAFLRRVRPRLSLDVQDNTIPNESCYSVVVYQERETPYAHGDMESMLVLRVSMLAPVYEVYESHARVIVVAPDDPYNGIYNFVDRRRTHEISEPFQHAATVFARAVEDQYGYQRLYPDVLDIHILHLAVWNRLVNEALLVDALFGGYRI